jgi:trimeric autotransporter adhesin
MPTVLAVVCSILCAAPQPAWAAPAATATALAFTSAGNAVTTVTSGALVTLTATVTAGSTAVAPGQINFCDATAKYCTDIHLLGTAQLTSAGTAALNLRPGIGSHSYRAVFVGTKANAASTSTAAALTVTGVYPTISTMRAATPVTTR